ncbi:MAG: sulfotransferase [bacterium]|nr:sulfotransferase [bacterium]
MLVRALEDEAQLTLVGRLIARAEIARILESRLRSEKIFRDHPEIEDEEVVAPLFVTGLARSGTSLLHELLWHDPDNRVPITWEMMYPAVAVANSEEDVARTIERAEKEVRMQDYILPAMRTMHELSAELPNECIYIFAHEFACDMFTGFFQIPSYTMWKSRQDPAPWYAYHRRFLQLLQWQQPRRRWVLKAPSHMNQLGHLFGSYPDAHVIITHRDPLRVLGSLANLMTSLQWMRSDNVQYQAVVEAMAFGHAYLPERVMEQRDKGTLPVEQIIDVRYQDLMADPIGTVRRIYEQCGTPLTGEAERKIDAWMKQRPKDRHGAHEYTFADTGLDLAAERARHEAYQAHFDIPSEV